MAVDLDSDLLNADWTKQTWDLPPRNGVELDQWLEDGQEDIEEFVQQPRFLLALPNTPWLQEWARRRSMTAAYVESEHPRDPGGEGGGQWVAKGTAGVDELMGELLALDRAPTDADVDRILEMVPLNGGPVDFGAFTLEKVTEEGEDWWDLSYPKDNPTRGGETNDYQYRVGEEDRLRPGVLSRLQYENHGRGFMDSPAPISYADPGWKGPRGQTWAKDVATLDEQTQDFYRSLSKPEYGALARWTGEEYKQWNEAIRDPSQMGPMERATIRRMDRVMARAPDLPEMTVYRGATATVGHVYGKEADQGELDFHLEKFPIGSRVQLAGGGFQAATPKMETAQQFGRTIFRIKNPRRGIQTAPVSWQPLEREVLIDRQEMYTVTAVELVTLHKGSPNEHKRVMVDVEYRR